MTKEDKERFYSLYNSIAFLEDRVHTLEKQIKNFLNEEDDEDTVKITHDRFIKNEDRRNNTES